MADFLSRLADRTRGRADTVRPRLSPLFGATQPAGQPLALEAPDEETASADDGFGEAPVVRRSASETVQRFAGTQGSAGQRQQGPAQEPTLVGPESRTGAGPEAPPPEEAPSTLRPATGDRPLVAATGTRTAQERSVVPNRSAVEAGGEFEPLVAIDALRSARAPMQANSVSMQEGRRDTMAPPAPAPTIHVSIGRVEVRAVFPPAEAPRQAREPVAPRLTLDDYLNQRSEGRR